MRHPRASARQPLPQLLEVTVVSRRDVLQVDHLGKVAEGLAFEEERGGLTDDVLLGDASGRTAGWAGDGSGGGQWGCRWADRRTSAAPRSAAVCGWGAGRTGVSSRTESW